MLVRAVAAALEGALSGARLRAFYLDHGARTVTLFFREACLTFRLHPSRGDVVVESPRDPAPDARPLPALFRGATVRPDDRVLRLHFRRVRGRPARIDMVVELMTNQWNAFFVEAESGIIRHALWSRDAGQRSLRSGSPYVPPPASERAGAEGPVEIGRWTESLDGLEGAELRKALVRRFAYTSSLNAEGILRTSVPADPARADEPGSSPDLRAAHAFWSVVREGVLQRPHLLEAPHGAQPYPVELPNRPGAPTDSLLAAFDAAARRLDAESARPATSIPSDILGALEGALGRARRRVAELRRQLDRTPDPEALRAAGDLLLARIHQVPPGAARVQVEGFDGEVVDLNLDPSRTTAQNAEALYERAARSRRARERIPGLLAEAEGPVRELEALLDRALSGQASVQEIERALPARTARDAKGAPGPTLPYRVYRSSGGIEIRVGRGARWNDDLTFRHSAPDDVWLHARHASGAHVVLRWKGEGNPPARDLQEAAILAAVHSRARTSGSVPVDWTRRKYVRKPRKAPPGSVTVERVKTVFVTPDTELAARLAED